MSARREAQAEGASARDWPAPTMSHRNRCRSGMSAARSAARSAS
jgi:hypothetical protein